MMIASIVGAAACSATAPPVAAPSTPTSAGASSSAVATAGTSTSTSTSTTTIVPSPTGVDAIKIGIDDPTVGHLVFDAIAAGDPARAKAGKLVLLLHGFPETNEAWRDQLAPLA